MLVNFKMFAMTVSTIAFFMQPVQAKKSHPLMDILKNNIPPRLEWNSNAGYCGEVSLISAGLFYGQYISQYDARAIATKNSPQNKSQLLLGRNDAYAAAKMHLKAVEWNTEEQQNPEQFLIWVKENVVKGYPVAIGIFTNEYRFYGNTDPDAGDDEYDHIVPVTGIGSSRINGPTYQGEDLILFNDNGLWGDPTNPPYTFCYEFDAFQADRHRANAENGAIYSLYNGGSNYGISILGVMDENGDTLPVRVDTNINDEMPAIAPKSNLRPPPEPLVLTITISSLEPNVLYNLYRYDSLNAVPDGEFNAHAHNASEMWQIQIPSGSTYRMTQEIQSDEVAVYRAVKASAP